MSDKTFLYIISKIFYGKVSPHKGLLRTKADQPSLSNRQKKKWLNDATNMIDEAGQKIKINSEKLKSRQTEVSKL